MPDGHGLRSRTRDKFSKGYRQNGVVPTTDILRTYKVGDYVDIKVNSAVHGGMPHKFYHGRTGVVWNITKRAVGVEVNKEVRMLKQTAPQAAGLLCPDACARQGELCSNAAAYPQTPCMHKCSGSACTAAAQIVQAVVWRATRTSSRCLKAGYTVHGSPACTAVSIQIHLQAHAPAPPEAMGPGRHAHARALHVHWQ